MSKESLIVIDGEITEALGNSLFRAILPSGHIILANLSGKIRMHNIHILPGDKVTLEMSPYDLSKGRIIRRLTVRNKPA